MAALTDQNPWGNLHDWGISSAGRAPALQAGGRRFDPDILHHTSRRRVADLSASADGTVAPRHRPKRLSSIRRAASVCHASGSCSLTIHGKRIEIVDGKSAGVKACQTPCRQRYYDCVNRYSSSKYANTTNLIGKRVNTQILTIQSVISVLDDVTLVG